MKLLKNIMAAIMLTTTTISLIGCGVKTEETIIKGEAPVVDRRVLLVFNDVRERADSTFTDIILVTLNGDQSVIRHDLKGRKMYINERALGLPNEQLAYLFASSFAMFSDPAKNIQGTQRAKDYADFYALLMMDEMRVNITSAVAVLLTPLFTNDPDAKKRYEMVMAKAKQVDMLQGWKD